MAHVTYLAAARHALLAKHNWDVEQNGLYGAPPIRILTSQQRHGSLERTIRLLGLGQSQLECLSSDAKDRLDPNALDRALKAAPSIPTILVLQAGDINIGTSTELSDFGPPSVRDEIDWNPDWSRRARGFATCAALRQLGRQGVARMIEDCCEQAHTLALRIGELPTAELLWEPVINQGLVRFLDPKPWAIEADHDQRTEDFGLGLNTFSACVRDQLGSAPARLGKSEGRKRNSRYLFAMNRAREERPLVTVTPPDYWTSLGQRTPSTFVVDWQCVAFFHAVIEGPGESEHLNSWTDA